MTKSKINQYIKKIKNRYLQPSSHTQSVHLSRLINQSINLCLYSAKSHCWSALYDPENSGSEAKFGTGVSPQIWPVRPIYNCTVLQDGFFFSKFDILTCVCVWQQWHWPPLFFFAAGSHSEGMGKDSSSMGPHSVETSTTVSIITSSAHRKKDNSSGFIAWVYVWPIVMQSLLQACANWIMGPQWLLKCNSKNTKNIGKNTAILWMIYF